MNEFLKKMKILSPEMNRQESLKIGFIFAFISVHSLTDGEEVEELSSNLERLKLSFDDLNNIHDLRERHNVIVDALKKEHGNREVWFNVGFWLFMYTWVLGRNNFALTTETVRDLLSNDKDIRKCGATLIEYLIEIRWTPDKIEEFNLNHLIPFLWDDRSRKYVGNIHMVPMSVLLHEAREKDIEDGVNSDTGKSIEVIKALIEEIPVVGKSISIVIWGNK
ncbi:hypothetical protein [Chryseobacterium arthrosphaerae]|uniref:hypothetical protein n=2 Tax=Chryseobacterium arthrosphaerae TaxID=651561 RepID=UPI00241F609E|nr:hypothetical protein [Chryseobacterium arthrosphaerae]